MSDFFGFDLTADLPSNMEFFDETTDPLPLVAGADLFLLTSREDPFPLAALEAMAGQPRMRR